MAGKNLRKNPKQEVGHLRFVVFELSPCHTLTVELIMSLFWVWSGCDLGGHSMFYFLSFCISLFWPGMVLNQGQLSIVVSDWEPELGCPFPSISVWEVVFVCGTIALKIHGHFVWFIVLLASF